MLVAPERVVSEPPPLLIWLHGRTAWKELDAGRYLRLMRAGIAVCAIDLPGHGDRYEPVLTAPDRVLDVVLQASDELDGVIAGAVDQLQASANHVAIGGMSAGGMACLHRLCEPHDVAACALEATSGDWLTIPMANTSDQARKARVAEANPQRRLNGWSPLPVLAVHCRADAWIPFESQWRFLDAVDQRQAGTPVERVAYDRTGAPGEHAGFGTHAADSKACQCSFLERHLLPHGASVS